VERFRLKRASLFGACYAMELPGCGQIAKQGVITWLTMGGRKGSVAVLAAGTAHRAQALSGPDGAFGYGGSHSESAISRCIRSC
jgi:hypothetical protein